MTSLSEDVIREALTYNGRDSFGMEDALAALKELQGERNNALRDVARMEKALREHDEEDRREAAQDKAEFAVLRTRISELEDERNSLVRDIRGSWEPRLGSAQARAERAEAALRELQGSS